MATDGGEVQVRLSQSGGDEVVSKLTEIAEGIKALAGPTTAGAMAGAAQGAASMATAFVAVGYAAIEAYQKVKQMVDEFIHVRQEYERFEIQIASLQEATMGWSAAMEQAKRNIQGLDQTGTSTDLGTMVRVFRNLQLVVGGTNAELLELSRRVAQVAELGGVSPERMTMLLQMAAQTGHIPAGRGSGAIKALLERM